MSIVEKADRVVARESELARLAVFASAVGSPPGILVIEGQAGVGKTTLLRWALARLPRGVASLRCAPGELEPSR
jgi:Cdc6-like AAA superfamily ATPase